MGNTPSATCRPVVIIGASTAGLFAAYRLAKAGVPAQVYDENEELGPPARTLILTGQTNRVLGFTPVQAIVNRTHTIELYSARRSLAVSFQEPDLIVERSRLVQLLAEKAVAAGATLNLGRRFTGLEPAGDGVLLSLEDAGGRPIEKVHAQALIGADGVSSRVAQSLGLGARRTMSLRQAQVAMPCWARPDVTQVWFDPASTRYFYWLVPESAERAVVGLIAEDEAQAQQSLDGFLEEQGLQALEYQDALVPFSMSERPVSCTVGGSRAFLVGDAAGQVKVTTVGGVVTGLCGAEAAVRAILRQSAYHRELLALRRELDLHLLVRKLLHRFSAADYDLLLELANSRMNGVLAAHNRDQLGRLLFPVLVAQPRLFALAAKVLLRQESGVCEPGQPQALRLQQSRPAVLRSDQGVEGS